jgi:photosystem II stability/assembly factor-like uncharacterized protein
MVCQVESSWAKAAAAQTGRIKQNDDLIFMHSPVKVSLKIGNSLSKSKPGLIPKFFNSQTFSLPGLTFLRPLRILCQHACEKISCASLVKETRNMKHRHKLFLMALLAGANFLRAQWVQQPFPTTETLYKVRFVNQNTGWILGENGIHKTADAGKTWMKKNAATRFGNLLLALNENIVFYSASNNISTTKATTGLRRTSDGGLTWQIVDSSYFHYFDATFVNEQAGYVTASDINFRSAILKTTDGGKTWRTIANNFSPANFELTGIAFVDEQRGWAVSYDAIIFHTRDGGATWTLQDSIRVTPPFFTPLRDIQFITADSGWAVGGLSGNQLLVRTTTGGRQWIATRQTGCSLRETQFLDNRIGWTVGATLAPPLIFQTTDGGSRWAAQSLQPPQDRNFSIESLSMLDQNLGWAVGNQGRVYKMEAAVAVAANTNSAPAQFRLAQNLPNPFSSMTRVNYEIAATGPVRLTVHDILGREVALLFSDIKTPGNYSAFWEGRDQRHALLPNGVYFCRLQAGDLALTRKLVLLR